MALAVRCCASGARGSAWWPSTKPRTNDGTTPGSFEEEIVEVASASAARFDLRPAQMTLSASVRVTFSLAGNS
jgi:hypothetical protein